MTERLWKNGGEMGNKRSYETAYKLEVVQVTRQPGKTVAGVAKEMGIPWKTVAGWVNRWNKRGAAAFLEPSPSQRVSQTQRRPLNAEQLEQENQRLRRENEILRQEREILKKATAFFAKELR
jgi:transposase